MRLTFRISLLAIGLASLLGPGAASAGTLVEFPNLPGHTPASLSGYLARPDAGLAAELEGDSPSNGGGPFPAIASVDYEGRAKCINLGHCTSGCAQGAKASTDTTYWSAAC